MDGSCFAARPSIYTCCLNTYNYAYRLENMKVSAALLLAAPLGLGSEGPPCTMGGCI